MDASVTPHPPAAPPTDVASYKRFLATALIVLGLSFAADWIWVWQAPMTFLDPAYPMWLAKKKLLDEGKVGTVSILGDSAPLNDMMAARMGPEVYNFALSGRGTIDALHIAKQILSEPTPPQAVLLSFAPHHLIKPDLFWTDSVGFGTLSVGEVEELRRKSRLWKDTSIFEAKSPFDLDVRLENVLYAIRWPTYYFPAMKAALQEQSRFKLNKRVYQATLDGHGHAFIGINVGGDQEAGLKTFVPSRISDDCFEQIVALFQAHHIPVYFISMPRNEEWFRQYDPGFKKAFADYLDSYAARYPNFHILGDVFPVYPAGVFIDAMHLDEKGAIQWTDQVSTLMNAANVPGGPFGPR